MNPAAEMTVTTSVRHSLLVLASTYPRWRDDPEPGFVHELCRRLVDRFDVTVLAPHAPGAARREVLDGVRVHRFRYAPESHETLVNDGGIVANLRRHIWKWLLVPPFFVAQWLAAWQLARTLKPDVIHAHWLIPQGLIAAVLRLTPGLSPPFLVTSHGADLFALRGSWLTKLKRWIIDCASAATVVSEPMRLELGRIDANLDKVSVQPMGVDLRDRFVPDSSVARSTAEILFVGRFVEKKGLQHLIAAMPAVIKAHPNARLSIIGFGPEEPERRRQVQELGLQDSVTFEGALAQTALPVRYRRAALMVAPFVTATSGDTDGLGLVLIEAIGCGCPVLAGDIPAVGGLPIDTVAIDDSGALAQAIIRRLSDASTAAQCAERVRHAIVDQFDWTHVAEHYAARLTSIAASV